MKFKLFLSSVLIVLSLTTCTLNLNTSDFKNQYYATSNLGVLLGVSQTTKVVFKVYPYNELTKLGTIYLWIHPVSTNGWAISGQPIEQVIYPGITISSEMAMFLGGLGTGNTTYMKIGTEDVYIKHLNIDTNSLAAEAAAATSTF